MIRADILGQSTRVRGLIDTLLQQNRCADSDLLDTRQRVGMPWGKDRDDNAAQIRAPVRPGEANVVVRAGSAPRTPALLLIGSAVELGHGVQAAGDIEEPAVLNSAASEWESYFSVGRTDGR